MKNLFTLDKVPIHKPLKSVFLITVVPRFSHLACVKAEVLTFLGARDPQLEEKKIQRTPLSPKILTLI